MEHARIAVAGASGLIGGALARSLAADGHTVVRLVRRAPRSADEVRWDPGRGTVDAAGLAGCDAVVNLAGAGVGDRRWTAAYKDLIRSSRVGGTTALAEAVAGLPEDARPRVFLNGSATGYYGETGDRAVDERAPRARGSCRGSAWSGRPPRLPPGRRAYGRCSRARGSWWRPGAGRGAAVPAVPGRSGRAARGRAPVLVVHRAARRGGGAASSPGHRGLSGPFNLTAPEPLTNREITAAMAHVLRRPAVFAVPAPVLRAVLGEMAGDVLGSARVRPTRLLESGFRFAFPRIEGAIRAAL